VCNEDVFKRLLALLLLLTLPAVVRAQWSYMTNSGTITITAYTGPAGGVTVPATINSLPVTSIGEYAFSCNSSLASVTIGNNVTSIEDWAFGDCTSLNGAYFMGNAPSIGSAVFDGDNSTTLYYLPGTAWGATYGCRPTALWNPQVQTGGTSFGVRTNRFGFTITGTSNLVIVVEACTNLANPSWFPVATNTLTGGSSYFSDPQWTNYPARFCRLRSP
jgi:BspA type Leucine rich repeat region (6 copies)